MSHRTDSAIPESYRFGHRDVGSKIPLTVSEIDTANTNNKKLANNELLGSANTDIKTFDNSLGALAPLLNQASGIMDKIYGATVEPTQKEKDINMGRIALQFFTQMGASASQPGQTALGAANIAGANVAQSYLAKVQSDKDKKAKLEQAKKSGGLSLAMSMQAQDQARDIAFNKPKTSTYKASGSSDSINYMTTASAIKYLNDKGMKSTVKGFDELVKRLTTEDPSLVGTPHITSGKPSAINFNSRDGIIVGATINQIRGSDRTLFADYKIKKVADIAKNDKEYINKMTGFIPNLKNAMDILLDPNVQTGGMEGALLETKSMLKALFGFTDEDLSSQQFLQSISNKLAPLMRPVGSGSTSDMEFDAYRKAILSLGNGKYANYLNLYTMKKMTENGLNLNRLEKSLYLDPRGFSQAYIDQKIDEFDKGIFVKFQVYNATEDGKLSKIYSEEENDLGESDASLAFKDFWSKVDKGEVFRNIDAKGQPIIDKIDGKKVGAYIIKGISRE